MLYLAATLSVSMALCLAAAASSTCAPSPPPHLLARVRDLATFTDPDFPLHQGLNRPFLSAAGTRARERIVAYMRASGLSAHVDPAGNVVARLACQEDAPRPALAMGSHFDTVRGGGMWDGAYGVLAAVAVAERVAQSDGGVCALPFDVLVYAFDDEEGNNDFGTTNFGAKAVAGVLTDAEIAAVAPAFVRVFGGHVGDVAGRVRTARAEGILAFVELHIEQGPMLEERQQAVGVVDAIAGQTKVTVRLVGRKGHAGTVPMKGRRDAVVAAAEAVLLVEKAGLDGGDGAVATVGRLIVKPGSSNVIAAEVEFSVDVRAGEDAVREGLVRRIREGVEGAAASRGLGVEWTVTHEVKAVRMSAWVREAAGEALSGEKVVMTSGAGHDTQFMARVADVGMVFVRCRGGVSHHVDEHVEDADALEGAAVLHVLIDRIAERVSERG